MNKYEYAKEDIYQAMHTLCVDEKTYQYACMGIYPDEITKDLHKIAIRLDSMAQTEWTDPKEIPVSGEYLNYNLANAERAYTVYLDFCSEKVKAALDTAGYDLADAQGGIVIVNDYDIYACGVPREAVSQNYAVNKESEKKASEILEQWLFDTGYFLIYMEDGKYILATNINRTVFRLYSVEIKPISFRKDKRLLRCVEEATRVNEICKSCIIALTKEEYKALSSGEEAIKDFVDRI